MSDRSDRAETHADAPREPYGVGPAYPSSHTQFTNDAPGRYAAASAPEPTAPTAPAAPAESAVDAAPAEDPYYAPSAEFTVADGIRDVGMVFVGASMTAGYGDPKGLGWVGRVVARTPTSTSPRTTSVSGATRRATSWPAGAPSATPAGRAAPSAGSCSTWAPTTSCRA